MVGVSPHWGTSGRTLNAPCPHVCVHTTPSGTQGHTIPLGMFVLVLLSPGTRTTIYVLVLVSPKLWGTTFGDNYICPCPHVPHPRGQRKIPLSPPFVPGISFGDKDNYMCPCPFVPEAAFLRGHHSGTSLFPFVPVSPAFIIRPFFQTYPASWKAFECLGLNFPPFMVAPVRSFFTVCSLFPI